MCGPLIGFYGSVSVQSPSFIFPGCSLARFGGRGGGRGWLTINGEPSVYRGAATLRCLLPGAACPSRDGSACPPFLNLLPLFPTLPRSNPPALPHCLPLPAAYRNESPSSRGRKAIPPTLVLYRRRTGPSRPSPLIIPTYSLQEICEPPRNLIFFPFFDRVVRGKRRGFLQLLPLVVVTSESGDKSPQTTDILICILVLLLLLLVLLLPVTGTLPDVEMIPLLLLSSLLLLLPPQVRPGCFQKRLCCTGRNNTCKVRTSSELADIPVFRTRTME